MNDIIDYVFDEIEDDNEPVGYALNIADDGRILSATFAKYAPENSIIMTELPEGDWYDYRYVDGEYIYDPTGLIEKESVMARIEELKKNLSNTDYNILKIVEGAATITEMADIISKRSKWRKEINELEKVLA